MLFFYIKSENISHSMWRYANIVEANMNELDTVRYLLECNNENMECLFAMFCKAHNEYEYIHRFESHSD